MQKFRTEIEITESENKFTYKDKLFFIGSCFTENIGNVLHELKFNTEVNPFGVLYNPLSVKNSLEILLRQKEFTEKDLQHNNDLWFSFYHHSSFSDVDKQQCLDKINSKIKTASKHLKECDYLFITFGTSLVYQLKNSGNVVSNCHKLPAKEFKRSMLASCEIYDEYAMLINQLKSINPDIKIILTVSPVRHLKDGAVQNQLSKATLLIAIHQLIEFYENIFYFPAYEIVMDDLRDYRFYGDDMTHPNNMAIKYIWEKFKETYIEKGEFELMKQIQDIVQASNHRPFNTNTETHKKFITNYKNKIEILKRENPEMNFEEELRNF